MITNNIWYTRWRWEYHASNKHNKSLSLIKDMASSKQTIFFLFFSLENLLRHTLWDINRPGLVIVSSNIIFRDSATKNEIHNFVCKHDRISCFDALWQSTLQDMQSLFRLKSCLNCYVNCLLHLSHFECQAREIIWLDIIFEMRFTELVQKAGKSELMISVDGG